jgi:hypothetical protein
MFFYKILYVHVRTYVAEGTPAVGQYDRSKGTSTHAGAAHFPKDKRFKEPG